MLHLTLRGMLQVMTVVEVSAADPANNPVKKELPWTLGLSTRPGVSVGQFMVETSTRHHSSGFCYSNFALKKAKVK